MQEGDQTITEIVVIGIIIYFGITIILGIGVIIYLNLSKEELKNKSND